jgi:predicted RNase H-like nuclease (RuvC/YqgF family)
MKLITSMGIGLALALATSSLPAAAQGQTGQNQPQSSVSSSSASTSGAASSSSAGGSTLGDYARQIRKTEPAAKPKVFDNDNLPTEDKLSIVGAAPTQADNSAPDTKTDADTKAESDAKPAQDKASAPVEGEDAAKQALWKQWGEKVTAQKDQIDLLDRELTVLQKEYQLRAAAMYGDVGNRLRNSAEWDKEDAQYKQQIADKQKALDEAKQKLDEMQEEARKAGVPSSFLGE